HFGIGRDCASDWIAVRALYRDFFRDAHACLRHAVPLVPVQVLLRHWRRQRHARGANENSWDRIRQVQQDRVSRRTLLLLLPWLADHRWFPDVANSAFAVRTAPSHHS